MTDQPTARPNGQPAPVAKPARRKPISRATLATKVVFERDSVGFAYDDSDDFNSGWVNV